VLNRTQYLSDVIALVVLWRLRDKLALRDLPEMLAVRGMVFSHGAVREWHALLKPAWYVRCLMEDHLDHGAAGVRSVCNPVRTLLEPKPSWAREVWVGSGSGKEQASLCFNPRPGSCNDGA